MEPNTKEDILRKWLRTELGLSDSALKAMEEYGKLQYSKGFEEGCKLTNEIIVKLRKSMGE